MSTSYGVVVESITVGGIELVDYTSEVRVKVGTQFQVNVTLKNNNTTDTQVYINLIDHNGNVVDQVTDTLLAGQQKTYILKGVAPSVVNTFTWKIEYGVL